MAFSFSSNSLIYNSKVRYNQKDCVKIGIFQFSHFLLLFATFVRVQDNYSDLHFSPSAEILEEEPKELVPPRLFASANWKSPQILSL